MRPLEGIKVLDLSKVIAGPQCGKLLGDLGADVLKVELPNGGDDARNFTPFQNGVSATFAANNVNKKSITLNLKNSKAVDILYKLVKDSDVFIENMITGGAEKLNIGYEDLKKINPRLIYVSVSGYGRTGPYAKKGGYELMAQAMGGIISVTGLPESTEPARVGYSVSDVGSGMLAALGVLAALLKRYSTGEGEWVQASLLKTNLGYASYYLTQYKMTGENPKPIGTRQPSMAPYQSYNARDGKILIGMASEAQWKRFCEHPKFKFLADNPNYNTMPERVKNRDELQVDIELVLSGMDVKEIVDELDKINIPCGAINTIKDLFEDDYVVNNLMETFHMSDKGEFIVPKFPIEFEGIETNVRLSPPLLGEHTEEILKNYGYTDDEIRGFSDDGVI